MLGLHGPPNRGFQRAWDNNICKIKKGWCPRIRSFCTVKIVLCSHLGDKFLFRTELEIKSFIWTWPAPSRSQWLCATGQKNPHACWSYCTCSVPIPRWVPMMQSSELLSRTQLRYDVPVTRMELLRRWCSGPTSGSNAAAKHTFSIKLLLFTS